MAHMKDFFVSWHCFRPHVKLQECIVFMDCFHDRSPFYVHLIPFIFQCMYIHLEVDSLGRGHDSFI